jgi:thiol-disulfide isomerase/thioredoxin
MIQRTPRLAAILVIALVVGACSTSGGSAGASPVRPSESSRASSGAPPTATTSAASPAQNASGEPAASPASPASPASGVTLDQPWATATLTNVRTGDGFRIADLVASGSVVFVEPMAIWCANCRAQQQRAMEALGRLDRSKVVWIGVDVEASESAEQLVAYSEENGFDFSYVIADRDLSRALAADFGDTVLNPPSTSVIIIGSDGTVTSTTGGHTADQLVELAKRNGA